MRSSVNDSTKAYIFFGPPGSGKGTLARICQEKFGWVQLSTGDLFRKHISEGTELGKQIDFAIKSGRLVDDKVVTKMVEQWIQEHVAKDRGFIFDGFPRTLGQAELFLKLIKEKFAQFKMQLIKFEISDQIVIDRLSSRRVCQKSSCQAIYSAKKDSSRKSKVDGVCDLCEGPLIQRNDDQPETIKTRLLIYQQHAQPLFDYYDKEGFEKIVVKANQPLEKVLEDFVAVTGAQL